MALVISPVKRVRAADLGLTAGLRCIIFKIPDVFVRVFVAPGWTIILTSIMAASRRTKTAYDGLRLRSSSGLYRVFVKQDAISPRKSFSRVSPARRTGAGRAYDVVEARVHEAHHVLSSTNRSSCLCAA